MRSNDCVSQDIPNARNAHRDFPLVVYPGFEATGVIIRAKLATPPIPTRPTQLHRILGGDDLFLGGPKRNRRGAANSKHAGGGLGPRYKISSDTSRCIVRANYPLFDSFPPAQGPPFLNAADGSNTDAPMSRLPRSLLCDKTRTFLLLSLWVR